MGVGEEVCDKEKGILVGGLCGEYDGLEEEEEEEEEDGHDIVGKEDESWPNKEGRGVSK